MIKIRVGFYLPNAGISKVDCKKIFDGNPGIGGTEFSMISLIYFLTETSRNLQIVTYAEAVDLLPEIIQALFVEDLPALKRRIIETQPEILVIRYSQHGDASDILLNLLKNLHVKIIVWAHCFLPLDVLNRLTKNKQVYRIICVGREHLDSFRDHPGFYKSEFIFNGINTKNLPSVNTNERPNHVAYVGSIIEGKGFDVLAKSWKSIKHAIPDAQLHVVGSGRLYNRNALMGKYGIAEARYENRFIRHLLNEDGTIDANVIFHGILGAEKFNVLNNTKVGVPNPSGVSETFGYTGVEMQLAGCMVVTKKVHGYMDTVFEESGILIKSDKDLAPAIIKLLQKGNYDVMAPVSFIKNNFDFDVVVDEWSNLFLNSHSNVPAETQLKLRNPDFQFKWLKEYNRKFKTRNKLIGKLLPPSIYVESIITKLKVYIQIIADPNKIIKKLGKIINRQ